MRTRLAEAVAPAAGGVVRPGSQGPGGGDPGPGCKAGQPGAVYYEQWPGDLAAGGRDRGQGAQAGGVGGGLGHGGEAVGGGEGEGRGTGADWVKEIRADSGIIKRSQVEIVGDQQYALGTS